MTGIVAVTNMVGRPVLRRIAAVLVVVGVVFASANTVVESAASSPAVTLTSLSPSSASTGVSTKATLVLHSSGKVAVQDVTVAVRSSTGANVDFPGAHSAALNGAYTYVSGSKTFAAGLYTEFGSYEVGGVWHPLASKTLTVSAAPTPSPSSGPAGVPGAWSTVFDDEFNGTALNTSVWQPGWFGSGVTGPVNGSEPHPYTSTNVTESGGSLNLALTASNGALVSSNPDALGAGKGYQFTGPAVLEARVFIPGTGSTVNDWPAFWSDGQSWPGDGEIDVMEGLGGGTAFHVHTTAGGPGGDVNVGPGWHTFAAAWSGTSMTFYYDGVNVGSEPYSTGNAPQYILFDNTSSASIGGPTVPGVMQVDYVKVYTPAG